MAVARIVAVQPIPGSTSFVRPKAAGARRGLWIVDDGLRIGLAVKRKFYFSKEAKDGSWQEQSLAGSGAAVGGFGSRDAAARYGGAGVPKWGTRFSQIESDGMAVGLELARLMMEQSVGDQAEQVPAAALDSGGEVAALAGTDALAQETPAGEVEWRHPRGDLKQSRRDFFPSGQSLGRGRG